MANEVRFFSQRKIPPQAVSALTARAEIKRAEKILFFIIGLLSAGIKFQWIIYLAATRFFPG